VQRSIVTIHPQAIVLVEAEIWPNFLWRARELRIPTFLVNARLSARSFRGYKRCGFLFRSLFAAFTAVGCRMNRMPKGCAASSPGACCRQQQRAFSGKPTAAEAGEHPGLVVHPAWQRRTSCPNDVDGFRPAAQAAQPFGILFILAAHGGDAAKRDERENRSVCSREKIARTAEH